MSIALFFGAGIPVLYFTTMMGCTIQYLTDRLLCCYFYRAPPTYDDRITRVAASIIGFFALVAPFGAWM